MFLILVFFSNNTYFSSLFLFQLNFLCCLCLLALVAGKALNDQQTSESQSDSKVVAQRRIGFGFDEHHDIHEEIHHHHEEIHHHEHHDPGFWKKRVTWKEGWKKIWKTAQKQIVKN